LQDCVFLPTAIWCGPTYFLDGRIPGRFGNGDEWVTPANLYPAKDGYVYIAGPRPEQIVRFYKMMGRSDLLNSPLSSSENERIRYKKEIDALVGEWTKPRTVAEILESLKKADIPGSAVPDFRQVCDDPQIHNREMVIDVEQLSGKVKAPGSIFKFSRTPGNIKYPAFALGQHNADIFGGMLGYTEEELKQFSDDGII
jgi:crotonobetainyl-CoA:carnitine CoA-transferase CaiB-like acyl-CoA transferase